MMNPDAPLRMPQKMTPEEEELLKQRFIRGTSGLIHPSNVEVVPRYQPGVTVVIPTIPDRTLMLAEAVGSTLYAERPPDAIIIVPDLGREGAGPTRQRGLMNVKTEWTAFLDDDDQFGPTHLSHLLAAAYEHDADVVFPWFNVHGGTDPFPQHEGRQWDLNDPHIFPITALVRTRYAQTADPFPAPDPKHPDWMGDDFPFWCSIGRHGARFYHLSERTWVWRHHGSNSSGLPSRVRWPT